MEKKINICRDCLNIDPNDVDASASVGRDNPKPVWWCRVLACYVDSNSLACADYDDVEPF